MMSDGHTIAFTSTNGLVLADVRKGSGGDGETKERSVLATVAGASYSGERDSFRDAQFSDDGDVLYVGGMRGRVMAYDVKSLVARPPPGNSGGVSDSDASAGAEVPTIWTTSLQRVCEFVMFCL